MAEAMIRGLLAKELVEPGRVVASGPRAARGEELKKSYGIQVTGDNCAAVQGANIVILSVKPQALPPVMHVLKGHIPSAALVLSIVAGARLGAIEHGLAHPSLVRSMPNTPAQIGQGMTVWTASPAVTPPQHEQARTILAALGEEIFVEDEDYLDMATALSGTGPAYVFLFMEALIDAAVHLGFSRNDARMLVTQTVRGSAIYAEKSPSHPAEMRNLVTSPGGTSAHALYQLEKGGFRTLLSKAVWAAFQRSVSLSTLNSAVRPFEEEDEPKESDR